MGRRQPPEHKDKGPVRLCRTCNGDGKVNGKTCIACNGSGRVAIKNI